MTCDSVTHDGSTPWAREAWIACDVHRLYATVAGGGPTVIVLHGGPDFDHTYLLPELSRLAEWFRVVFYDQRGRGRSASGVAPEDVALAGEIRDIEGVREWLGVTSAVLLGHSWGCVLALEYALQHPAKVDGLILLNPAPASAHDDAAVAVHRREKLGPDADRLAALASTPAFERGDPDTLAAYYEIAFGAGVRHPEHAATVATRLRSAFTVDSIALGRAIESRLMVETYNDPRYDMLPRLARLSIPTLVVHGAHDFIPMACSANIARAIPGARLEVLNNEGHFAFLETPDEVITLIRGFLTDRPDAKTTIV